MVKTSASSSTATTTNIIKIIGKRGTDCSGTSGTANRVLTLSNTTLTVNTLVFINGTFLHPVYDYTLSNLSASSTITFLNPVWDNNYIDGFYLT